MVEVRSMVTFIKSIIIRLAVSHDVRSGRPLLHKIVRNLLSRKDSRFFEESEVNCGLIPLLCVLLSDISLPKFDSDIYQWPAFSVPFHWYYIAFCDRFRSLVDQELLFFNIKRIYYLLGYLMGSAVDVVCGISVFADM